MMTENLTEGLPERLLQKADVLRMVGFGNDTLYRLLRAGTFPQPIKVHSRRNAWRLSEILTWIASRPRKAMGRAIIRKGGVRAVRRAQLEREGTAGA